MGTTSQATSLEATVLVVGSTAPQIDPPSGAR